MVNVFDIARYILTVKGQMTTWKLQKLIYYSQAWSLVWDDEPLFESKIEAWANGPVCRDLYTVHKGNFYINDFEISGNIDSLSSEQKSTVDSVLKHYGDKSGGYLSDLTHFEEPWKQARADVADGANCNNEITHASMAEYYSNL